MWAGGGEAMRLWLYAGFRARARGVRAGSRGREHGAQGDGVCPDTLNADGISLSAPRCQLRRITLNAAPMMVAIITPATPNTQYRSLLTSE